MRIPFLELASQYRSLREEVDAAVARVLAGGRYILGEEVLAFEREFADHLGAAHAVGVASGTDALTLALRAVGVTTGDRVATVPATAVPTVAAIVATGARPVFVDVGEDSCTMDPTALARCLAEHGGRVRAVVPVHLYGRPCEMEAIVAAARAHGAAIVEDAAQAHGARIGNRAVGTFGDAAAFSFYPTKNLGACGDGGAVVTGSGELAARVRRLRNYGEEQRYLSVEHGANSRLDELQAAILRVKLRHLGTWNERRRLLAARYRATLAGTPLRLPEEAPGTRHVFHLFVVRTPERDRLREHLAARGIGSDIHYPRPVHLQPAYRALGYREGDLPAAERLAREALSLPLYPELADDAVDEVARAVREFFG